MPYSNAVDRVFPAIEQLQVRVQNDPIQRTRARTLQTLAGQKMSELRVTIEMMDAGNRDGALATVDTDLGKSRMDEIRKTVAEIQEHERAELAERSDPGGAGNASRAPHLDPGRGPGRRIAPDSGRSFLSIRGPIARAPVELTHLRRSACRAARRPLAIAPGTVPLSSADVASPAKKSVPRIGRARRSGASAPPTA